MSWTYATLKTAIGDYLECAETTFTNHLDTFIKESEDRILSFVQLPQQRKNVQGTTSTNSRFLACPTDFLAPMSLAVISSSTYDYLDLKHASFLKEYSPTTSVTGSRNIMLYLVKIALPLRQYLTQHTQWSCITCTSQLV